MKLFVTCVLAVCLLSAESKIDLVIVSSEEAAGDEECRRICSGTTGRTSTDWVYFNDNPGFYTDVDMADCGFVKIPTITTSLGGAGYHWRAIGSNAIYSATSTKFRVYLSTEVVESGINLQDESFAEEKDWNIGWMAVGYTC